MDIYLSLIDWNELERRLEAGTLQEDILESYKETWLISPDPWYSSAIMYNRVAEILEHISGHFDDEHEANAIGGLSFLIDPVQCDAYDVDEQIDELCVSVLNPTRVSEIAARLRHMPAREKLKQEFDDLPEHLRSGHAARFRDITDYLAQWVRVLAQASSLNFGILIHVG